MERIAFGSPTSSKIRSSAPQSSAGRATLSYVGRILVLNTVKGGVATAWMLGSRALLFNSVNPIMAQGAAFAGVALIDRFDQDVTEAVRTRDRLIVEPKAGTVQVLR